MGLEEKLASAQANKIAWINGAKDPFPIHKDLDTTTDVRYPYRCACKCGCRRRAVHKICRSCGIFKVHLGAKEEQL